MENFSAKLRECISKNLGMIGHGVIESLKEAISKNVYRVKGHKITGDAALYY